MTDLAIRRNTAVSFAPTTFEELMKFAELASRTEIVPKDYQGKVGNIVIAVQMGAEVGFSPTQALQSIAVINGRASIWGDGLLGLVRASGICEYVKEWVEGEVGVDAKGEVDVALDTRVAYCETKRRGEEQPVIRTFSVQDARKAGLWMKEGPWRNYPMRQMGMRARSWCLRDTYADVIRGLAIAEEVQDIEPLNVTPPDETAPAPSRADQVRAAVSRAAAVSAAAVEASVVEPPAVPVVEGVVEPPLPDFSMMLAEQIGDVFNDEAMAVGMDPGTLRETVKDVTAGKKPGRATAPAIVRAIRKWGAVRLAEKEAVDKAAAQTAATLDLTGFRCPIHGAGVLECVDESCRERARTFIAMQGQPTLLESAGT